MVKGRTVTLVVVAPMTILKFPRVMKHMLAGLRGLPISKWHQHAQPGSKVARCFPSLLNQFPDVTTINNILGSTPYTASYHNEPTSSTAVGSVA